MKISERTLKVLEYDKIIEMLASCAPTEGGKDSARALMPTDDFELVLSRQRKTTDAKRLISYKGMPPFGSAPAVSDSVGRAEKGATLSPRELMQIAKLFTSARQLHEYISVEKDFETSLDEIFLRLIPNKYLENKINSAIISEDMIADEASSVLADIRRKIRNTNNKIRETLQKYVTGAGSRYLQENIVTMRNGRYVVPVKIEYKNEVKGLVHDTSASGSTVFVEPAAVLEANNELRVLESKEEREIERILSELSAECGAVCNSCILNFRNITELSLYFACAQLSFDMKAEMPKITDERTISLSRARHPLINRERVVPITVDMSSGFDTMVITGPNTGGKTVSLKTLGLSVLMVQSGLHIPAGEDSLLGVFDSVFADIGDEQSIEQSLSTFSAHMVNIISIIKDCGERSLVLFDELGAGTDPVEGAALATAILENVREKGALTAATTHYAELKAYALDTEGVCNASCEFDVETLKPTYRLIMGTPGKSNAFAIAGKLGLPESIIDRAGDLVSGDSKRFELVIEKLEENRIAAERNKEETRKQREEIERLKNEYEKKIKQEREQSKKALADAEEKARRTIESAKASVEFVLDKLDKLRREKAEELSQAEYNKRKKDMRGAVNAIQFQYEADADGDDGYVLPRPLVKGDEVKMQGISHLGILLENPDKSGNVRVQFGQVVTKTKAANLRLIEKESGKKAVGKKKSDTSTVNIKVDRSFKPELDLRGMMTDDAWFKTDKYIDDAVVAGIRQVRIIHGKGTGALKNYLWSWFKTDRRIASFRLGAYGEGDAGVTVLELK